MPSVPTIKQRSPFRLGIASRGLVLAFVAGLIGSAATAGVLTIEYDVQTGGGTFKGSNLSSNAAGSWSVSFNAATSTYAIPTGSQSGSLSFSVTGLVVTGNFNFYRFVSGPIAATASYLGVPTQPISVVGTGSFAAGTVAGTILTRVSHTHATLSHTAGHLRLSGASVTAVFNGQEVSRSFVASAPEPGTPLLLWLGLIGTLGWVRRRASFARKVA